MQNMTTPVQYSTPNIIIIGAGIGGLVTALYLKKSGIKSKLYESSKHAVHSGAGITLSINAMTLLANLGVSEDVIKQGQVINEICITSPNGKILSNNVLGRKKSLTTPSVAIHRKRLHQILSNALGQEHIHYSKTCVAVDPQNNNCRFDDGERAHFDLLIGSDGINSAVCSFIGLQQPSRDANQICFRGTHSLHNEHYNVDRFIEMWGNAKRFGFTNIGNDEVYWYATLRKDKFGKIAGNQIKAVLHNEFAQWSGPIDSIIQQQDESLILRNDLYDRKPISNWHTHNVVLLGDAIHSTTPNMGQGAAMAIESAAVLSHCLSTINCLSSALNAYQAQRISRTKNVTELSWQIGKLANMQGKYVCKIRNACLHITPNWFANKSANQLFYQNIINT